MQIAKSGSGVPPLNQEGQKRDASATLNQEGQRRDASATFFNAEQLAWLYLIRDHIATAISIEPEDSEHSPFNQRGGLGRAHQLFGEQLPELLDELNAVLAA
ncbi:MAG: type I restriction-modification enzyme R subunit C-terminal domain-containing protein [Limisphaerales bacterium]